MTEADPARETLYLLNVAQTMDSIEHDIRTSVHLIHPPSIFFVVDDEALKVVMYKYLASDILHGTLFRKKL
jgi:hypothetical protein